MLPAQTFLLDGDHPDLLSRWLQRRGWIDADDRVLTLEPAGAGNMNLTLRATLRAGTLILKQGRPWVERYPDIPAPPDRGLVEAAFYEAVAPHPEVAGAMPALLHLDEADRMLALEDLGAAADCSDAYAGREVTAAERGDLLGWLSALHRLTVPPQPRLANRAMRELNHEHMFALPLRPGALDADAFHPGLEEEAASLRGDGDYTTAVGALGRLYLEDGESLLHGDFYPGSWLRTAGGVRIIDPEFCFLGPAEFDVGVMLGHAVLAGGEPGAELAAIEADYQPPTGFRWTLCRQLAGVEVMRRLIGVAQLPLQADLARRVALLRWSRTAVLYPEAAA